MRYVANSDMWRNSCKSFIRNKKASDSRHIIPAKVIGYRETRKAMRS
jgi:hypothetical protein